MEKASYHMKKMRKIDVREAAYFDLNDTSVVIELGSSSSPDTQKEGQHRHKQAIA